MSQAYDGKVDIWAAGCTLYEVMMLRRAFTGDDMEEILAKVVYAARAPPPPPPPRGRRRPRRAAAPPPQQHGPIFGDWTAELEELLLAMLRMRTKERPTARRAPHERAPRAGGGDDRPAGPRARGARRRRRRRRRGASSSPDASARDACVCRGRNVISGVKSRHSPARRAARRAPGSRPRCPGRAASPTPRRRAAASARRRRWRPGASPRRAR